MESPANNTLLAAGTKCAATQCGLHDYLPYKCQFCNQSYCSTHFRPAAHQCEKEVNQDRIAPPCPLCSTPIAIPAGGDPNAAMERHFDQACEVMGRKKSATPRCARHKCGKVLYTPIRCESCNELFCPTHRHPSTHRCASTANVATSAAMPGKVHAIKVENRLAGLLRSNNTSQENSSSSLPAKTRPAPAPSPSKQPRTTLATVPPNPKSPSSSTSLPNPFSKVDRWVAPPSLHSHDAMPSVPAKSVSASLSPTPHTHVPPPLKAILDEIAEKPKPHLLPSSFVPPSLFGTA